MTGPCMCGDPYCPSCGDPGAAAWEDAMDAFSEWAEKEGLDLSELETLKAFLPIVRQVQKTAYDEHRAADQDCFASGHCPMEGGPGKCPAYEDPYPPEQENDIRLLDPRLRDLAWTDPTISTFVAAGKQSNAKATKTLADLVVALVKQKSDLFDQVVRLKAAAPRTGGQY